MLNEQGSFLLSDCLCEHWRMKACSTCTRSAAEKHQNYSQPGNSNMVHVYQMCVWSNLGESQHSKAFCQLAPTCLNPRCYHARGFCALFLPSGTFPPPFTPWGFAHPHSPEFRDLIWLQSNPVQISFFSPIAAQTWTSFSLQNISKGDHQLCRISVEQRCTTWSLTHFIRAVL